MPCRATPFRATRFRATDSSATRPFLPPGRERAPLGPVAADPDARTTLTIGRLPPAVADRS